MLPLNFLRSRQGVVAPAFAFVLMALLCGVGLAIDYNRLASARAKLQWIVDSATLAAAQAGSQEDQLALFKRFVAGNGEIDGSFNVVPGSEKLTVEAGALAGELTAQVPTILARLLSAGHMNASVFAKVNLQTAPDAEIALVLDVSSSMIEEGRFEPMREAAAQFVTLFSDATPAPANWKIALVPFSSRINFGLNNPGFFKAYEASSAFADRWAHPETYYNSSYVRRDWIDGTTFAMDNGTNIYWMGCAEPRLDVAVKEGKTSDSDLDDTPPSVSAFAPMDANTLSGTSFCPPPVVPLTSNATALQSAIAQLTSQGSTRLDAGLLGGWYATSPRWSWQGAEAAAEYGLKRKIVVFMTDGRMNTQDGGKHFDWVCNAAGNCDANANTAFLSTCAAMKSAGIEIYTVSYDKDAETKYLRQCASGPDKYFEATSSVGSTYIRTVYEQIARSIRKGSSHLTQ